jgi:hypothetical protein
MPEIVSRTPVASSSRNLTVSTVKLGFRDYDTVVFDDSSDKQHAGKRVGKWVIDCLNVRASTRAEAMDNHREALLAARSEPIR